MKGARFELARSTDQQITLVKKDLNLHLKSVTLDQLGQPSQFVVKKYAAFRHRTGCLIYFTALDLNNFIQFYCLM